MLPVLAELMYFPLFVPKGGGGFGGKGYMPSGKKKY